MLDIGQTFSSNILLHEQMFDHLATSANKANPSGKSNLSYQIYGTFQRYYTHVGSDTLFDVSSNIFCLFSHPMLCATNMMFDEMFDRLAQA